MNGDPVVGEMERSRLAQQRGPSPLARATFPHSLGGGDHGTCWLRRNEVSPEDAHHSVWDARGSVITNVIPSVMLFIILGCRQPYSTQYMLAG